MKISIESHRWRLLPGPRPCNGSLSDWGWTSLSLRVASMGRRLGGSTGWRRRVSTKGATSTPVHIMSYFLSCFVMVCSHFSWWFWLKFLFWCCNFSGMALDQVTVDTRRKSMLSTSKISCKGDWWECTIVWWGSELAEEWSVCFSWNWSQNPYSAEVHCRFSFFSAI
jgi:hypothetical protein